MRNEGTSAATGVWLYAPVMIVDGEIVRGVAALPPIEPGETVHVPATIEFPGVVELEWIRVYSSDITDIDPADNVVRLSTAPFAPSRGRATRR